MVKFFPADCEIDSVDESSVSNARAGDVEMIRFTRTVRSFQEGTSVEVALLKFVRRHFAGYPVRLRVWKT